MPCCLLLYKCECFTGKLHPCNDQCIFHILTSVEINDFILCLIPQRGSCYVGNPDLLFGNCKFHASGLKTISMYGKFNPFVELY